MYQDPDITRGTVPGDSASPRPTFESGYVGVVTWTANYIGWPFRLMFTHKGLLWLIGANVVLGIGLVLWMKERGHRNSRTTG